MLWVIADALIMGGVIRSGVGHGAVPTNGRITTKSPLAFEPEGVQIYLEYPALINRVGMRVEYLNSVSLIFQNNFLSELAP